MAKRQLPVKLDDVQEALTYYGYDVDYYLDLDTGAVVMLGEDVRFALQQVWDDDPEPLDKSIRESDKIPDWMRDLVLQAAQIENDERGRYLSIPRADSPDDYEAMEDFIDTITDLNLRQKLATSIQGKGAFRRFRDVLVRNPEVEARWYTFKDERLRQRAIEWLAEEGIEVI
jgi:hypothetical protein